MRLRALILLPCLLAFAVMAILWNAGMGETYRAILYAWGFVVASQRYVPFLDTHAVLSALQCHQMGFDVFVQNPCDILGRMHNYSPVWLAAASTGIGIKDTAWVGSLIGVAFLATASLVANPTTIGEMLLYLLALLSTSVVFAVERGNVDMLLFMMIAAACWVFTRGPASRLGAYGIVFGGALLKFYPIAAFGLALTENRRRLIAVATLTTIGWVAFLILAWSDLAKMWPNVPHAEPLLGTIAGRNFFVALEHLARRYFPVNAGLIAAAGGGLYLTAVLAALVVSFSFARRLLAAGVEAPPPDWPGALFLAGGFIIVTAFFTGQNAIYRGIWLLALFPVLIRLRRGAVGQKLRWVWNGGLMLAILLLWFQFFYAAIWRLTGSHDAEDALVFLVHEPLWWIFVTGILSLLWVQLSATPWVGRLPMLSSAGRARW